MPGVNVSRAGAGKGKVTAVGVGSSMTLLAAATFWTDCSHVSMHSVARSQS